MSERLQAALEERRRAVEAALERALPAESEWPSTLHQAMRYSLFAGGKRIRPLLALAACESASGAMAAALPFACALEMVHTFSLVHDDLPAMDDDDLRRGKPTCHKVFGEAVAILAGDALFARAFELLHVESAGEQAAAPARRMAAAAILAEAVGSRGLIGGQIEDMQSEGRTVSPGTLERIHRTKTGALIAASVRGGAVLGGADAAVLASLTRYASAIGLAFQIVDDILDATGSAEELGKTAGKDDAALKATYVRVHGLPAARRAAQDLLAEASAALAPLGERAFLLDGLARLIVDRRA